MSNGYISITINEQAVGLRFGMPAIKRIAEKVRFKEGEEYTEADFAQFMYAGYLNNCLVKEMEPTLSYEDFYNFAEEAIYTKKDVESISKVIVCFNESRVMKAAIGESEKKSSTAKQLKKNSTGNS